MNKNESFFFCRIDFVSKNTAEDHGQMSLCGVCVCVCVKMQNIAKKSVSSTHVEMFNIIQSHLMWLPEQQSRLNNLP